MQHCWLRTAVTNQYNVAHKSNLRNRICGVLSVTGRRPWSGNGNRSAVDGSLTYGGMSFRWNYINLNFLTSQFLDFKLTNFMILSMAGRFFDPVLAPTPHEACAVFTSDVTFGSTESFSGIFFSRLTAAWSPRPDLRFLQAGLIYAYSVYRYTRHQLPS